MFPAKSVDCGCSALQAVAPERVLAYLVGTDLEAKMPRLALTDRFIATCKADGSPQSDYFDDRTPGLALRVTAGGHKAWSFLFSSPRDGKRARLTLGT